ncbi:hypothetical protein PGQ11_009856 [Apiospora arundinis]|uniref:Uncharacterized protein n=1 Tax=Apiospora arundinis TaxID=335852 RepID=A0ABR2I924_9PEZI
MVNSNNSNTTAKQQPEPLLLCRGMLSFPCLVPPLFLDLLGRRDPWALATHVRELWWVGDTPGREVRAIYAGLPGRYRELLRGRTGG